MGLNDDQVAQLRKAMFTGALMSLTGARVEDDYDKETPAPTKKPRDITKPAPRPRSRP
jgi:hypothetical protein